MSFLSLKLEGIKLVWVGGQGTTVSYIYCPFILPPLNDLRLPMFRGLYGVIPLFKEEAWLPLIFTVWQFSTNYQSYSSFFILDITVAS